MMLKRLFLLSLFSLFLLSGCRSTKFVENYYGHFQAEDGSELFISKSGIKFKPADPRWNNKILKTDASVIYGARAIYNALNTSQTGIYVGPIRETTEWLNSYYIPTSRHGMYFFISSHTFNRESNKISNAYFRDVPNYLSIGVVFQLDVKYKKADLEQRKCPLHIGQGLALAFVVDTRETSNIEEINATFSGMDVRNTANNSCFGYAGYSIQEKKIVMNNELVSAQKLTFKRVK